VPDDRTPHPRLRRAASFTARLAEQPRVLLAVKTALAAVLAWYLAPYIPFAQNEYSYYAPLGALVTMHPTIARSARVGAQVLMGLAAGILLSFVGITIAHLGVPGGIVLALVLGIAVLVGGVRFFGAGRDWVALAALFVLLTAGGDPEGFSVSYLVTMAFGVLVGVAVNFLVLPPLYLRRASERLSTLREAVTGVLDEAADAVARGEIDRDRFSTSLTTLSERIGSVSAEVSEADESSRVNPRQRRHAHVKEENAHRMAALERTAFLTRDLVDLLVEMQSTDDRSVTSAVREELAEAIRRAAALVSTPVGDAEASKRLDEASEAFLGYQQALGMPQPASRPATATAAAVELCLRRIIDVSREFV
jgi:uncharacterized membrane protein YgaE (UPF0421/DUF939 family)